MGGAVEAGRRAPRLEAVLSQDRLIIAAALVALVALAWGYLAYLASRTGMSMGEMAMPLARPWGAMDFVLMFVMWAVMMVAMMVPTAAPIILLLARISRKRSDQGGVLARTSSFVLGYLAVWWGFAMVATAVQWGLHQTALLSSAMGRAAPALGGAILIASGLFQWTRLKDACLRHCRSPLGFLMTEWRRRALVMGLRHGIYCLGCCWFLMALMFVGGVMNLAWMAGITAFVLLEKLVPAGDRVSRVGGAVLVGWGLWLLLPLI